MRSDSPTRCWKKSHVAHGASPAFPLTSRATVSTVGDRIRAMADRITLVLPREQAGPQTGRKYEVQYEEAALSCLKLLEEGEATCVYCEWHDDFVVEQSGTTLAYAFHQMKTRADASGAWSMPEILGVKKPRAAKPGKAPKTKRVTKAENECVEADDEQAPPPPVKLELRVGDSIAHRMLDHYRKFKDACAIFVLVSPAEIAADPLLELVRAAKGLKTPSALSEEPKALFAALLAAYQTRDTSLVEAELWGLLTRLDFAQAKASESEPRVAIGLMGQMIHELSEVDVSVTEQARIALALLKVVRERSHAVLKVLPSEAEVRTRKAVSLPEVIKLLPLSLDGYQRLRAGDGPAVKSLSRLQRLCRDSNMDERLITSLCDLKVEWQAWRARVGDSLTSDTLGVLRESGLSLLTQLTTGMSSTRFTDLQTSAQSEATRLTAHPRMPGTLTARILMGLVFALAAESE
jgi:hypothetical protein